MTIQANFPTIKPSLNLDFANVGYLDPRVTFTNASNDRTYFDEFGVMQKAAANVPRFDHNPLTGESLGLLIEEQRTNLLLNSLFDGAALSTQSVTVTSVPHTLSFYGTGTITLSGASTAGPLVGTGAFPNRTTLTFTPSAGSLTLTVSGDVNRANLEIGAFATSFIPTAGSQVTRAADSALMTGANFSDWYNPTEGTLFAEADTNDVSSSRCSAQIFDGSLNNRINLFASNSLKAFIGSSGVTQLSQGIGSVTFANNIASKSAVAYATNNGNAAANGTLGTLDTALTVPVVNQMRLGGISTSNAPLNGHIKRFAYYPRRLSDAQLQALTG